MADRTRSWRHGLVEALARVWARPAEALARRRVTLGFAAAAVTLVFAEPSWVSWAQGLAVAASGEAARVWAAGHLEKSREVTRSGPYRVTRHPLYVGSAMIALGIVIASRSMVVAMLTAIYMVTTIAAAIRTEEAYLRDAFGAAYEDYRSARGTPMARRFSWSRAIRNREHRAILGVLAGFGLLALRIVVPV